MHDAAWSGYGSAAYHRQVAADSGGQPRKGTYVDDQPDSDPVRALAAAERDDLLDYRGYTSGDRYEVDIAGETRTLAAADVVPTVERLRLIQRLADEGLPVAICTVRYDMSRYVMEVNRQVYEIPSEDLVHWLGGYEAGLAGAGGPHAGTDRLDAIRQLLTDPGRDDACRLVILGLMHGQDVTVSTGQLAERTGRTKKAIVDALKFGRAGAGLTDDMAVRMLAAFGRHWPVTERGYQMPSRTYLARMPGIARLWLILEAAGAGLLHYLSDPDPNVARWLREYQLSVGAHTYTVPAAGVAAWLDGLRAGVQQVIGGKA